MYSINYEHTNLGTSDLNYSMPDVTASPNHKINVVDVYELAATIGKEFELLIDRFGPEVVSPLMPKVIHVLEHLEDQVLLQETEGKEILTLQNTVARLESEKQARAKDRVKYERDMELLEEGWRSESKELQGIIEQLQDENRLFMQEIERLKSEERTVEAPPVKEIPASNTKSVELLNKMKQKVDMQRCEIRHLKKDLSQKCIDLEVLQQEVDRLVKQYSALRRRHCLSRKHSEQLVQEKSQLEVELQAKEQVLRQMRRNCVPGAAGNSRCGSASSNSSSVGSDTYGPSYSRVVEKGRHTPPDSPITVTDEEFIQRLNQEGKMVIDFSDKEQPRFSMNELKEVLIERNQLKHRLLEVEEELSVFKKAGDYDAPVQGPINKEPEDKLCPYYNKNREFGIKKFFQELVERLQS